MEKKKISFSDCTRHLYIPNLNTISKMGIYGMRTWLIKSNNYIVTNSNENYVDICFYDIKEPLSAWASDISRLSCAFLESIANVKESSVNRKFTAWNIVQYYYSAFYSAHCILKILGFGLVQLDSTIISEFNKRANVVGITLSNKITKGIYCVKFDNRNNKIVFYKIARYDDSHKGLWKRFIEFLNVLTGEYIVTNTYGNDCIRLKNPEEEFPLSFFGKIPSNDALDAQDRIEQLKAILNLHGDANWLSSIRNMVNYSHGLGSWFPYINLSDNYDKVAAFQKLCFNNFLNESLNLKYDDVLMKFVISCQLINALNYDILDDLKKRSPTSKSFLDEDFFKYFFLFS